MKASRLDVYEHHAEPLGTLGDMHLDGVSCGVACVARGLMSCLTFPSRPPEYQSPGSSLSESKILNDVGESVLMRRKINRLK